MMTFTGKLRVASLDRKTFACVGLDPDPTRIPVEDPARFNKAIIDATHDLVCAYKLQLAFYEALGLPGFRALEQTVQHIKDVAPNVIVIGDGKRGDIGFTAAAYARAMFEVWDFDAATVNVYQGTDAIQPFLEYPGRGVFAVCRSSNPSARDFQDLLMVRDGTALPLYRRVAQAAERWSATDYVGLVVGATYPDEIRELRRNHPSLPFLIPGVGAQGGDAAAAARAGVTKDGFGIVISSSREVIYSSGSPTEFASAARDSVTLLRSRINNALASAATKPSQVGGDLGAR